MNRPSWEFDRIRTSGTLRFNTLAVCRFRPLSHTSFMISCAKVQQPNEAFFRSKEKSSFQRKKSVFCYKDLIPPSPSGLHFYGAKVNRRRRMTSVFSTDFAKSSFPYCERVFDEIRTTPSDCLSQSGNLLLAS